MRVTSSRRRVAAATAVALLTGALTAWVTRPGGADDPAALRTAATPVTSFPGSIPVSGTSAAVEPTSRPSPGSRTASTPSATATPSRAPQPPTQLVVPRLGARMRVDPVAVDRRGDMAIPQDPRVAGWYRFGATPDRAAGATVIAAHVDDSEYGTGPLAGLGSLRRGDPVSVRAGGAMHAYRVTSVLRLDKGQLDTDDLFDRAGAPRLHLVTCGGAFDRATGHYEDNIVVVATPVD